MNANLQQALTLAPLIRQITDEVLVRNIGRQELIHATWAGLISGRPLFTLGPTGVNKTATIRQMAQRIAGAVFDERLIPGVKSAADLFVEATEIHERTLSDGAKSTSLKERLGRAANAHIFYGDEYFKDEDHPVLNSLIDYSLEGIIRHEGGVYKSPLMLFVASGNETPDPLGRLGAVWSRLTMRLLAKPLDRTGLKLLINTRTSRYVEQVTGKTSPKTLMNIDDVQVLRNVWPFVNVPEPVIDIVLDIRDELGSRSDVDFSHVIQDDRRTARIFDVMRAVALMAGRDTVTMSDLSVLKWFWWDNEDQIPALQEVLIPHTKTPLSESQELVNALMSPTGAFMLAKGGDIRKSVDALAQAQATVTQLKAKQQEAMQAGESTMAGEILDLFQQVQYELEAYLGQLTGRR